MIELKALIGKPLSEEKKIELLKEVISDIQTEVKTQTLLDKPMMPNEKRDCLAEAQKYKQAISKLSTKSERKSNVCEHLYAGKSVIWMADGCLMGDTLCKVRGQITGVGSNMASARSENGNLTEGHCSQFR